MSINKPSKNELRSSVREVHLNENMAPAMGFAGLQIGAWHTESFTARVCSMRRVSQL
jgi:hypothetical protein